MRYGAAVTVPSRLEEPATGTATVVLVATAVTGDVTRAVGRSAPGRQPGSGGGGRGGVTPETAALLCALGDVEVVWLATRQGHAAR